MIGWTKQEKLSEQDTEKAICKGESMNIINEMQFEITKTLNNIKKHEYSIGDYPLCEKESEVVIQALEFYRGYVKSCGENVVTEMENKTESLWQKLIKGLHHETTV